MRKLFSTKYSAGAFNAATLVLRLIFGSLIMINHGYGKLITFSETAAHMPRIFGMSPSITTALVVFAEFFCGLFIILGLFTRMAAIPLVICMGYALFVAHHGNFKEGEMATLYLGAFLAILFVGPGRVSVDGMIGK